MNMSVAAAWVTIIAALSAAIVSIINAWLAAGGRNEAKTAAESAAVKLDTIHDATNGGLAVLKAQLSVALAELAALKGARRSTDGPPTS